MTTLTVAEAWDALNKTLAAAGRAWAAYDKARAAEKLKETKP